MTGSLVALILAGPLYVFDASQLIGSSATPAQCVTRCGLEAPVTGKVCEALQHYEIATLIAFEYRKVWTMGEACEALAGWRIKMGPKPDPRGLFQEDGFPNGVWGLTFEGGTIVLGSFDWPNSALAHEMAHVINMHRDHDFTHILWASRGICQAINDVSKHLQCWEKDPSYSVWKP